MKRTLYTALAATLVVCSSALSAESLGTAIAREQKQLLQGIIDRMTRSIDDNIIIVSEPDRTREALYTLRESLGKYSCELGCICDTLRNCISKKCIDLAPAIEQCLAECAQRSENPRELTPEEYAIVQEKISQLTQEFFMLQLVLFGKVDYVVQDILQRYGLETYAKLATPFALFALYCVAADTILGKLQKLLGISHKDTLAGLTITGRTVPTPETKPSENPVIADASNGSETKPAAPAAQPAITRADLTTEGAVFALFQIARDLAGSKEAKFLPSLLVTPAMLSSAKKITQMTRENVQQTYSKLANRKISSLYPVKKPRFGFEAKPKFAHIKTRLAPVIDFCSKLTFYRTIDAQLTRGYILQGDLKDGRDLGEAIAGELAARCKKVKAPYTYGVYDIHSSKLLNTDMKKIMAECNEYGPTVLVINDIGWLCERKNVKPIKYAEIINELTRATLQNSNGNTLVILTTRDTSKLERLLQESYRFTVIDLAQTF